MQNLKWAGLSDVGRVRSENQDRWFADPAQQLFIVSDGVGGHFGGDLAAEAVTKLVPRQVQKAVAEHARLEDPRLAAAVTRGVARVSRTIRAETQGEPGLDGMGATVVLALIREMKTLVVHLGDSRAYLLRERRLCQLTQDHTLVQLLVDNGDVSERDAKSHPGANQLTRCVGMEGDALPDARIVDLRPADRLLLCSDGLSNMLDVVVLECILSGEDDPEKACKALIDRANAAGGRDNITAVVVAV